MISNNYFGSAFKVFKNTPQAFPTGGWYKVVWEVTSFDNNNCVDLINNRIIPKVLGLYLFITKFSFLNLTDGAGMNGAIYKNGLMVQQGFAFSSILAGNADIVVPAIVNITSPADYLEVYASNGDTGGARSISGDGTLSYFCGSRIM